MAARKKQTVSEPTPPAVRSVPGPAPQERPAAGEWTVVVVDLPPVATALKTANLITVDDTPATAEEAITGLAHDSSDQLAIIVGDDGSETLPKLVDAGRALGVNIVVIARATREVPPPSVPTPASLNDIFVTLSSLGGWPRLLSPDGWATVVETLTAPPSTSVSAAVSSPAPAPAPAVPPIAQAPPAVATVIPDAAAYAQADYQASSEAWAAHLQAQQAQVARNGTGETAQATPGAVQPTQYQAVYAQMEAYRAPPGQPGYPVPGGPPQLPQPQPGEDPAVYAQRLADCRLQLEAYAAQIQARATYQPGSAQTAGQQAGPVYPVAAAPVDIGPERVVHRDGKVVPVISKKGGPGKTSMTLSIADYLARSLPGRRIAVLDANIEQGDCRVFLERHLTGNVSSLEELRLDPILSSDPARAILRHMTVLGSGLHVLFAPPGQVGDPALLSPAFLTMVARAMRDHFDWILVDTQSAEWHDEIFSQFVIPSADRFLVVVNPTNVSVKNNADLVRQLQEPRYAGGANVAPSHISFVLNRNDTPGCLTFPEVNEMLGYPHFVGVVPERAGNFEAVATADRPVKAALAGLCSRLTGDPGLTPKTTAGRRIQLGRLRKLIERGGGR